jgi:hypothetical protein
MRQPLLDLKIYDYIPSILFFKSHFSFINPLQRTGIVLVKIKIDRERIRNAKGAQTNIASAVQ